jgi:hypothetical protein
LWIAVHGSPGAGDSNDGRYGPMLIEWKFRISDCGLRIEQPMASPSRYGPTLGESLEGASPLAPRNSIANWGLNPAERLAGY